MIRALLIILVSLLLIGVIASFILIQTGDLLVLVFATPVAALFIAFLASLYFRNKHVLASKIQRVCKAIFIITQVNIVSFFIILLMLGGGSAPNGKIEGAHYFLGNHGYYREVPSIVYFYSLVHTCGVFVTGFLSILAHLVYSMTGSSRQLQ